MPGADGMSAKFMKNAFVGWTFTAGQYYPPDYDPSKLLPLKHLKNRGENREKLLNIRMMFPFTMICDSCGEYNYTGTKFTAKTETIKNESYLGLKVYRFYGRCKHCWSEFTFKTDPKNSDYTMESGGKRTYEAWKDADMAESELKKEKENEAKDQMKALEQKSIDVQAEMQRIEDLDAIRSLNKRGGHRDASIEDALEYLFMKSEKEAEAEAAGDDLDADEKKEVLAMKEAQEMRKRQMLDEEVEKGASSAAASSSSAAAKSDSLAASSSGVNAAFGGSASSGSSGKSAREEAVAKAVAERASAAASSRSAVGARFTVKRKAPEADEKEGDAKRSCTASSTEADNKGAASAGATGAAAATGGCLGLGSYESDSS